MRIASLLASGTELVCALDAGDCLVGRSHECDYPSWVERLPVLSRPTFDIRGSSREINERVAMLLHAGEPLYEVDEALLDELAPDVLITQTHCEVCAVSPKDVSRAERATLVRELVVALRTGTLHGILEGFTDVAQIIGRPREGKRIVSDIRGRLERVQEKVQPLIRPTVVCLEWIDPIFCMGNWGPEILACAGGTGLLGARAEPSARVGWADVCRVDPEVLVVAPCGFRIDRTLAEMPILAEQEGWEDLRAVRAHRVFVADGNRYFNRSGPSAFETVEVLAEILHPDEFPPRHGGDVWQAYPAAEP